MMSLVSSISPHLPHLRRFARALTGSQCGGDAYAMDTIEAVAVYRVADGRITAVWFY